MKKLNLFYTLPILLLMATTIKAQDWATLKRYQTANTELLPADSTTQRIVFMGNSITEGWINQRPEFFKDKAYINRGIGGQTTPQMLIRFRQDVVDLHPQVVIILAGINDIAGNTGPSSIKMIADNIKSMAEIATANNIKTILCSVLPAYDFPWRPGLEPAEKVVELNKLIRDYAEAKGHIYVDYFSSMADDQNGLIKTLGSDGVHPNDDGYKIMEPLIEAGIKEALSGQ